MVFTGDLSCDSASWQDWALKDKKSPYIVRRGAEHLVDRERISKRPRQNVKKEIPRSVYVHIQDYPSVIRARELHTKLNEVRHLEDYMRWLAFNYIIKCGDYSDEL
jgi:hypothetical protein